MQVGLWIDHRKTIIAIITEEGERYEEILSSIERQPRRWGGASLWGPYESRRFKADGRQHQSYIKHLNAYYDSVIERIRAAEAILLFGPGETKVELFRRLESDHLGGRVVGVETVDDMTDRQVGANARTYFKNSNSVKM